MNNPVNVMNSAADNIRALSVAMIEKANSGHPGGAMGGADFINVLFSEFLIFDPDNAQWKYRDRFFLDPGHMSAMLYAQLSLINKFTLEDLKEFRQWGSETPGHPERCIERGIENSSGPLGQGHVYAVGAAMAAKFLADRTGNPHFGKEKIYTYISDGGIQEEIAQGAGRIAGHLGLNNLIMFFDANDVQLSSNTEDVISEDTAMKYRAWNWNVIEIDGNDCEAIRTALVAANEEEHRPTLIIGRCIMAKGGVRADGTSYEGDFATHGAPLGGGAYENTLANLGADPSNPFVIRTEVKELYANRLNELRAIVAERRKEEEAWVNTHPIEAQKIEDWFANKLPVIDWAAIQQKPNSPTRNGSSEVLSQLAKQVENMVVSSADLCNSDKTDGFLKQTKIFKRKDFSGAFFQAGVSELTMACVCIGMTLHGGVITAMGTFFVFSDYMKPAIRMAALMRTPVKFIWTHDAFRVGEDGPTHQPVEQEAQIRLLEQLKNHNGQDSVRVFRPADVEEVTAVWRAAMENFDTPTALIFSRQNVNNLPVDNDYTQVARGAYLVIEHDSPDVVLVASGSEVSTLVAASNCLAQEGIKANVVSCPSEGLFRKQSTEYQEYVLPSAIKKYGLTAGLPVTMLGLVGSGKIHGMNSFGFSAPYTILEEKLGFTTEAVVADIKDYLANG